MTTTPTYLSFLVRMWREEDPKRPQRIGHWQGEIEHIQTGQRWTFDSLDALLAFLRQQAVAPEAPNGASDS
jgi:hypothetical protein